MKNNSHQAGLTLISWIILILLIGFVAMFGFRLFPIYMEYYSINASMNTAAHRIQVGETPAQIRLSIDNLFTINGVNDVTPEKNVTISSPQADNTITLTLHYDERVNFIGNVDLLVHFHKIYRATPH